jgi:hypothetical protein
VFKKYIQLQIDFLDRPDDPKDVGRFIYGEIEDQLRENYDITITDDNFVRGVLHSDLTRFNRSPEGKAYPRDSYDYKREELNFIKSIRSDRHLYLGKVLTHIRSARLFSLAIFFDNLDRRSEQIQEEAYLRASALAREWACLVFVCLRPNTFYRSRTFGVLDSVAPTVINVVSPNLEHLLVRRLKYAKRYAEGTPLPNRSQRAPLGANSSFQLPSVATVLECLVESFRRNSRLTSLFEAISNGNARDLLTYVYNALTSLHLDTNKIISSYDNTGSYIMRDYEALRAILFGNSMHYEPEASPFINLFDIHRADRMEHFSRFLALHHLASIPEVSPSFGYGALSDVIRYLCQLGYSEEHARYTIRHIFYTQYCESADPIEDWSDTIRELRITTRGRYHINV